jgi:hypothetical protein
MKSKNLSIWFMVMVGILMVGFYGCSSGGSSNSGSGSSNTNTDSAFVGSWALCEGDNPDGAVAWYVHFNANKTFTISNNADKSGERVSGTYTVSNNNSLVGPFTNPGVGDGRVECSLSNGVLTMDFIEYWHEPNKHMPYAGKKIK